MNSPVEKWLRRQMAGEMASNLIMGSALGLIAVPLLLLQWIALWFVVRVARGANPFSEVFGQGSIVRDSSMFIALLLLLMWFAAYWLWSKYQEAKRRWKGFKEDDPPILDLWLILLQILFAVPGLVHSALGFLGNAKAWASINVADCSAVLEKLLSTPHRVSFEDLRRELPRVKWDELETDLRLIPGVVFLTSRPPGLSLTGELREAFMKSRWEGDWRPPRREQRLEFGCTRCGQRLRVRQFQIGSVIRCPQCHARYRSSLDAAGRLRMEPEPERRRDKAPAHSAMQMTRHLRTLGLDEKADVVAVRRAYRQLMKQHHPDLFAMADPPKRAQMEEKAKEINEAYHALLEHLERS